MTACEPVRGCSSQAGVNGGDTAVLAPGGGVRSCLQLHADARANAGLDPRIGAADRDPQRCGSRSERARNRCQPPRCQNFRFAPMSTAPPESAFSRHPAAHSRTTPAGPRTVPCPRGSPPRHRRTETRTGSRPCCRPRRTPDRSAFHSSPSPRGKTRRASTAPANVGCQRRHVCTHDAKACGQLTLATGLSICSRVPYRSLSLNRFRWQLAPP